MRQDPFLHLRAGLVSRCPVPVVFRRIDWDLRIAKTAKPPLLIALPFKYPEVFSRAHRNNDLQVLSPNEGPSPSVTSPLCIFTSKSCADTIFLIDTSAFPSKNIGIGTLAYTNLVSQTALFLGRGPIFPCIDHPRRPRETRLLERGRITSLGYPYGRALPDRTYGEGHIGRVRVNVRNRYRFGEVPWPHYAQATASGQRDAG